MRGRAFVALLVVLGALASGLLLTETVFAQTGIEAAFTAVEAGVATAMGYAVEAVVAILGGVLILMAGRALLRRFAKV